MTLGYLIFVIYGSLVPLEYKPVPFDEALQRLIGIRYLKLGIWARADWVANILLFIPLSFLFTCLLWPSRPGIRRLVVSILILAGASLLSLGIEFTQIYFPQRTVSLNDIVAETLGAAIGIALWWWRGQELRRWTAQALETRGPVQLAERLLWVYLAGLFLYSLLPLDLTISPVEIFHKWSSGKINLIPFGYYVADPAQRIYDLVTDALIWAPVSLLWVVSGRRQGVQAWAWVVLAATLLECMQFFVYSRVSDITDILTAMIGAGVGVWGARFLPRQERLPDRPVSSVTKTLTLTIAAGLVWTLILMAVFWYPFDFRFDWSFLRERTQLFLRVPFHAYYYGTEFRAVTELLHKILFFLPLGAVLAFGRPQARPPWQTIYGFASMGILFCVAFGIELGQLALPHKNPDATDWILEVLGGCAGYFGMLRIRSNGRSSENEAPSFIPGAGSDLEELE